MLKIKNNHYCRPVLVCLTSLVIMTLAQRPVSAQWTQRCCDFWGNFSLGVACDGRQVFHALWCLVSLCSTMLATVADVLYLLGKAVSCCVLTVDVTVVVTVDVIITTAIATVDGCSYVWWIFHDHISLMMAISVQTCWDYQSQLRGRSATDLLFCNLVAVKLPLRWCAALLLISIALSIFDRTCYVQKVGPFLCTSS